VRPVNTTVIGMASKGQVTKKRLELSCTGYCLYQEMQTVMIRRSDRLRIFAARSPPISASGSMLKPVTSWELREHPCSSGLRPSATNPSGTPNTTAFQQVYSCGLGVRSSSTSPAGSPARCTKPKSRTFR